IFDPRCLEGAFLRFEEQIIVLQDMHDFMHDFSMFLQGFREDEDFVHHGLEGSW
ncbi:hypothetical protein JAAARDRAFT_143210, partial [Jaapia argillacea MUCL 33604]